MWIKKFAELARLLRKSFIAGRPLQNLQPLLPPEQRQLCFCRSRRNVLTLCVSTFLGASTPLRLDAKMCKSHDGGQNAFAADPSIVRSGTLFKAPTSNKPGLMNSQDPGLPPPTAEYKPWPPAKPSARHTYPDRFIAQYINRSAGDLFLPFEAHLLDLGYDDVFYFRCGKGLALATRFERISDDAYPILSRDRFDVDTRSEPADLADGFSRIVHAHVGRYRAFVFFLTEDKSPSDSAPKSFSAQRQLLLRGRKYLEDELKGSTVTRKFQFMMFAYEYCALKKGESRFVCPSKWYGIDHLRRSRIETGIDL